MSHIYLHHCQLKYGKRTHKVYWFYDTSTAKEWLKAETANRAIFSRVRQPNTLTKLCEALNIPGEESWEIAKTESYCRVSGRCIYNSLNEEEPFNPYKRK